MKKWGWWRGLRSEWERSRGYKGEQFQHYENYNTKPTTFCITAVLKSTNDFRLKWSFIKYSTVKIFLCVSVNTFQLPMPNLKIQMKKPHNQLLWHSTSHADAIKQNQTSLVYYLLKAQTQQSYLRDDVVALMKCTEELRNDCCPVPNNYKRRQTGIRHFFFCYILKGTGVIDKTKYSVICKNHWNATTTKPESVLETAN